MCVCVCVCVRVCVCVCVFECVCVCVSSTCRSDRVLYACININNPHEYLMNANEADLNHSISVLCR